MPADSIALLRASNARAHKRAQHHPDDPAAAAEAEAARRAYYEALLAKRIEDTLAVAPPLTDTQLQHLAGLILGGAK